jgi:uncharacterized membrane protein
MRKWFPVIPIGGAFLFSALVYSQLPDRVATHWGLNGQPDGYSGRVTGAFMLPGIMLLVWALMRGLPYIDPRRANYAKFQGTYDLMVHAVITMMALVHLLVLGRALGWPMPDPMHSAPVVVGIMTIILGNVMPRARPNWWFGIRTPWTLSSDTVWTRTHRMGGYLFTAAGIVTLFAALLPATAAFVVLMIAVCGASLGAVVYSYFAWRQEQS